MITDQQFYHELIQQNIKLEELIKKLQSELNDVTNSILLRGYLYKWKDNVMTFGSKWNLRYFILNRNILNYYDDENSNKPRKTINLNNCMILDEGMKGNYYIFSICLHNHDEITSIRGPTSGSLLRLSSDNISLAKQWIEMLCKGCEYGTDHPTTKEDEKNSDKENEKDQDEIINKNKNDTTDHDNPISQDDVTDPTIQKVVKRVKSSRALLRTMKSSSSTRLIQLDQTGKAKDSIKKAGKAFAGSRNIHVRPQISPLSVHAKRQNYRGFFNLVVIILLMSHFRIIVDNLAKYGYGVNFFATTTNEIELQSKWSAPQPFLVLFSWLSILFIVFLIEIFAQKGYFSDQTTLIIQSLVSTMNVIGSCCWVWFSKCHLIWGILYLLESIILWMKLISYVHCNRDLRIKSREEKKSDTSDNNSKPSELTLLTTEMIGLEPPILSYPMNLTFSNLLYFSIIPTLCYQINYPRSPSIRWKYVATLIIRMICISILILYVVNKHITPALNDVMQPIHDQDILLIFQQFIHISLPNTYVWLLGFYAFFHLWLNLLAELTRFSDREFYLDWWNARTIDEYWRLWNLPVHHWMLRHLYYPIIRLQYSKKIAVFCAFLFSALLHEIIISIPFRRISYHAFIGMLAQAPLVTITRKVNELFNNQVAGNVFFWLTFCIIGQPVGVILYYYESYISNQE